MAQIREFLNLSWDTENCLLETDIEDGSVNLTVINTILKQLPATGVDSSLMMFGIGTALATVSIAIVLVKKKKKVKSHEV